MSHWTHNETYLWIDIDRIAMLRNVFQLDSREFTLESKMHLLQIQKSLTVDSAVCSLDLEVLGREF